MEKETKQTTETTEKKQNWFKQNMTLCIICAVVLVAAVVAICFFVINPAGNPEKVAQEYVAAMSEGNSDKLLAVTDLKGAYAWDKSEGDISKFLEEYKKVSDSDVNSFKDDLKKSLDSAMSMLKAFGGVQISLKNVEKPEDIGNGLSKVKATMQMEAFGQQQDQNIVLVVYNGKYVGELSE